MKARLFTLALAIAATALTAHAESIPIDEAHFPDPVFRNFVLTEMKYHKSNGSWALVGADGQLSDYERKNVVTIELPDGCQSAEGIKYFAKSETGTWGLKIYVKSDDLKTLDLSGMDVTKVIAGNHKLETLNVAVCTKLETLECPKNRLTTLNVEGCTKLTTVECYENQITALNVGALTSLRMLDCHENSITGLNINSPALQNLNCSHNPMTYLFLPVIDYGTSTYMTELDCSYTQIPSLDLRDNRYSNVNCSNSPITGIEWSKAGNGIVVKLNCSNTHIILDDILAIPHPERVTDLYCEGCGLTTIDVSHLTALQWLHCNDNLLTTLDVSANTALRGCLVNGNRMFALDVSATPCKYLGNSSQYIEGQAVEMDGKTYVQLNSEVNRDSIDELQVWHGSQLMPTTIANPTMQGEYLLVDVSGAADVSKVQYKYHVGNGAWMWVEITTGDYGVAINEYNFPDRIFRNYLLGRDYGQDALLTQNEIAAITELDVQDKNIASLEGIQYLRYLTYLNVSNNNLTDAGFSDLMAYLPNLTELRFDDNEYLTRFDAGQNTKLRILSGWGCALTTLDVRGCTELQELVCDDNQLTFLNLSENTKLRRLQCSGNQLTEIYGLESLTNLDCSNNLLTSLDVSNFPMLVDLACGGNSLTTLDLRQNAYLRSLYVEKNQLSTILLPENAPLKWLRIYGNQLKNDAMRAIVERLPTLATTYNVRAYYEGLSTEGNELSAAVVSAMRARNWNPQYTTNGTSWQNYDGVTVTYALKLCGTSVTSANAADLSAISGVTGTASFDELTNTLTLSGVTVNHSTSVGLESSIDGLTIVLEGNNTFNITGFNGLYLHKKTTITGTGTLAAISNKNGIYIYADTLFVKGGATVSGASTATASTATTGYGIYGRTTSRLGLNGDVITYYGSLAISGDETKVQGLGATASIGQLKSLTMPTGTTIKVTDSSGLNPRQVNGYFYDHSVCTRSGNAVSGYTYTPATGLVVITTPKAGLPIDATNFPDEAFRNYLLAQSYGADAMLSDDELENINTMSLYNLGIADLTGIEYFTELEWLNCSFNNLTQLCLSENRYLKTLLCQNNQLTELKTTNCNDLHYLYCYDNQLNDMAMKTLISTLPTCEEPGELCLYHEGSPSEGNNISMARLNYLWNSKNWACYFSTDIANWIYLLSGDVNRDGAVTIADVTALVNIILGKSTAPAISVADVNSDYSVTIADVTALVNIILGK